MDSEEAYAATRAGAEGINRALYAMARDKTMAHYREAVALGIIDGGQAEALMGLWLERHPYEPMTTEP